LSTGVREITMRHLKILGLAVAAAMSLMLFVGADAASATTLTTTTYPSGAPIDLSLVSGSTTRLTSPMGTTVVTCSQSTAKGKTTQTSGTWIEVDLETLTWGGCTSTVNTVVNGKLEMMWTSETSGEVVGRETQVTTVMGGITCVYSFGEGTKLGTIVGGENPRLKFETKIKKASGGFACPTEPTTEAEYVVTEPQVLLFSS
jgi:hypothetical protein